MLVVLASLDFSPPLLPFNAFITSVMWLQSHMHTLHRLTPDEAGAIYLYTMEFQGNVSLYTVINTVLRSTDRKRLAAYGPFLRLLLGGLGKLPRTTAVLHRGVLADLSPQFIGQVGRTVSMWHVAWLLRVSRVEW